MKMMMDETKKGAHAMIVRRLDDGNATSLTWLKSREERDVDADAHDDDECSAQARRKEKRCGARRRGSESLDVGGPG